MNNYQTTLATGFSVFSVVLLLCALFYPMIVEGGNRTMGYVALSSLFVAQILISTVFRSASPAFLQRDIERFTIRTTKQAILMSLIIAAFMVQSVLFAIAGADITTTTSVASAVVSATSGVIVFSYLGLYITKSDSGRDKP